MHVTIIGAGTVGLATAARILQYDLADVHLIDSDESKVMLMQLGCFNTTNEQLPNVLLSHLHSGKLKVSGYPDKIHTDVAIVAVDTGDILTNDLVDTNIYKALRSLTVLWKESTGLPIAIRSTIPPDIAAQLVDFYLFQHLYIVPEFLREKYAYSDAIYPERVVIGCPYGGNNTNHEMVRKLFSIELEGVFMTDFRTACAAKIASNVMLMTRLSVIHDIANTYRDEHVDISTMLDIIKSDHRLGSEYLTLGVGPHGSCLQKDTQLFARNMPPRNQYMYFVEQSQHTATSVYSNVNKLIKDNGIVRVVILGLSKNSAYEHYSRIVGQQVETIIYSSKNFISDIGVVTDEVDINQPDTLVLIMDDIDSDHVMQILVSATRGDVFVYDIHNKLKHDNVSTLYYYSTETPW